MTCLLKQELQTCCFTLPSSNSPVVQLYMAKQMDAKGMLTNNQYEFVPSTCSGYVNPTTLWNFRHVRVRLTRRRWVVPCSFTVIHLLKDSRASLQL